MQVTKSFPQLHKRLSSAHGSCFTLSVFLCNKYLVSYYKWSSLLEARFSLLNAADLHGHYSFSLFLLAVASRSWLQKYMEKMNMRAISNEPYLSSSHVWFSYIYSYWLITSQVYYEPTQWLAFGWLVGSVGRALHHDHRGHGFKSCTGLKSFFFFFSLFSTLL